MVVEKETKLLVLSIVLALFAQENEGKLKCLRNQGMEFSHLLVRKPS